MKLCTQILGNREVVNTYTIVSQELRINTTVSILKLINSLNLPLTLLFMPIRRLDQKLFYKTATRQKSVRAGFEFLPLLDQRTVTNKTFTLLTNLTVACKDVKSTQKVNLKS